MTEDSKTEEWRGSRRERRLKLRAAIAWLFFGALLVGAVAVLLVYANSRR